MKSLKAIIVDDEKHARESLSKLVELYCPEVKIIADAANIREGKQLIEKRLPDLVFLDIAIGEETGFDLLEILTHLDFHLVFTTAFSEFATRAFRVNALDYLLKPIDPEQLQEAIEKVKNNSRPNQLRTQLTHLTKSFDAEPIKQIAISSMKEITYVDIETIIHIEGSGNYSTFYLNDGEKVLSSKSLKHFESILPETVFFRCHQSHLINLDFIKRVVSQDRTFAELNDGTQVPVPVKRKNVLMSALSERSHT